MTDAGAAVEIQYASIEEYIDQHRVDKGSEFTHTSLSKPTCSFYVPADEMELFYGMYSHAVDQRKDLYVTEKNRHIGPILIDLDFRFKDSMNLSRRYSNTDIDDIIGLYVDTINEYLDLGPGQNITLYVMEKPAPILANGVVKDGLHIVIPNIATRASIKHLIRNDVMNNMGDIVKRIGADNKIEDIVDEAVIQKNNWFMFGSKKPNGVPYKVTHVFQYNASDGIVDETDNTLDTIDLVKTLSIRNKYEENVTLPEKKDTILEYEKKMDKQRSNADSVRAILSQEVNQKTNCCDDIELVEQLVDILSNERCESYNDWIRLGWCLRNIDNRLLGKWKDFSMRSPKYNEVECDRMWNNMKDGGLGTGTLHMWAKADNLEKYRTIMHNDLKLLMYQSTSGTHHDVARVVHHMYKHSFVCASLKFKSWYEFRDHRWHVSDSGLGVRMKISDDVWREYHTVAIEYTQTAIAASGAADQTRYQELAKRMNDIAIKLRTTGFKENVMKECSELFYAEKFEERLDSNPSLIGFDNGVFDFTTMEFREGRPEDNISFTTRNNYVEYNPEHDNIRQIENYLSQVLVKAHLREYVMKLFASFLNGAIKEQKFYIWTGTGSNSKSMLVELFEGAFGDYCCKFPITLLTQKRAASNAAQSEIARAKGKRFVTLQEPSEDEKLNVGLMKELSGGDVIMARALYKEPIEFKPMFKMLLLCNHLPAVPSDDGGTWRRIRVVEFTSKFCENPVQDNEFPIDYELSEKMVAWRPYFMSFLLEYYKHYLSEGACEPPEVIKCTLDYKSQNDYLSLFIQNKIEKKDSGFLSLDEVYTELKNWIRDDGVPVKTPSKPDLEKYLGKNLTKCVVHNHMKGFKGYRVVNILENTDEDLID
jgi:P4 family phage/plasmid primase-like protien